jgi:hypothetical protein
MKTDLIKGSMMRYLTLWSFRVGAIIIGYAVAMLTWSFLVSATEWAGTFLGIFMAGVGLIGGGIAGKGFQKRYENNHQERQGKDRENDRGI